MTFPQWPLGEVFEEQRRWLILHHLEQSDNRQLADEMIGYGVRAFNVPATVDQVRGSMAWLAEQGFVTIERFGEMVTCKQTRKGREIITQHRTHPGLLAVDTGS